MIQGNIAWKDLGGKTSGIAYLFDILVLSGHKPAGNPAGPGMKGRAIM